MNWECVCGRSNNFGRAVCECGLTQGLSEKAKIEGNYSNNKTSGVGFSDNKKSLNRGIPAESDKGFGVVVGSQAGCVTSVVFLVIGGLLCLTGVGMLLGVPLILMGLIAPFIGPFVGLSQIKGPCPYCSTVIHASSKALGINCPACRKRIVIKDNVFIIVD